jgi:hypothetical protein
VLAFTCPVTQNLVRTSLETSAEQLKRLGGFRLSLWCPHCHTGHQVVASDARVLDTVEPEISRETIA